MLISKDFLRDVGLMSEDYFLYCEEIDWAVRGKNASLLPMLLKVLFTIRKEQQAAEAR